MPTNNFLDEGEMQYCFDVVDRAKGDLADAVSVIAKKPKETELHKLAKSALESTIELLEFLNVSEGVTEDKENG